MSSLKTIGSNALSAGYRAAYFYYTLGVISELFGQDAAFIHPTAGKSIAKLLGWDDTDPRSIVNKLRIIELSGSIDEPDNIRGLLVKTTVLGKEIVLEIPKHLMYEFHIGTLDCYYDARAGKIISLLDRAPPPDGPAKPKLSVVK